MIDEAQEVFAGHPEATRLAEHIVAHGGPAGVGLVVTSRSADLAYLGGSATLRAGLAARNRMVFDTGTAPLYLLGLAFAGRPPARSHRSTIRPRRPAWKTC
ncbi:hypothetical protein ACGFNU_15900 [Spirillospora sp. NPDC048911]|uniref:hypothetical protein n=1 Tax=Spirillospora sp. NPDC048911 TaxID=3364527 RepID=UPI0037129F12